MYTCQTCSKEYDSQKRYLSHLERCGMGIKSRSRSGKSMTELSDIEDENKYMRSRSNSITSSSNFSDKFEKLITDKAKYKTELKRCKGEIKKMISNHHTELRKSQEYFQEQINLITDERDYLIGQINVTRDEVLLEKDSLHKEFAKKMDRERVRLESRYGSGSSNFKQLQKTISNLEERLGDELKDIERVTEEYDNRIGKISQEHSKVTEGLHKEIKDMTKSNERERDELHKSIELLNKEKNVALTSLRRQKEKEKTDMLSQINSLKNTYENSINSLIQDNESMKNDHDKDIAGIKVQNTISLSQKEKLLKSMENNYTSELETQKVKYESIIKENEKNHETNTELLKKDFLSKIQNVQKESTTLIDNLTRSANRKIEEQCLITKNTKKQIEDLTKEYNTSIKTSKQENSRQIREVIEKNSKHLEMTKNKIEKQNKENMYARDETINELEKINHLLGQKVGNYQSVVQSTENTASSLKHQFVANLNKQKEENEILMRQRDSTIQKLEAEIDNMKKYHSRDKTNLSSEVKKLTRKIDDNESNYRKLTRENQIQYEELISLKNKFRVNSEENNKITTELQKNKTENQYNIERLKISFRENSDLTGENREFKNQLREKNHLISQINLENHNITNKMKILETNNKELTEQVQKLKETTNSIINNCQLEIKNIIKSNENILAQHTENHKNKINDLEENFTEIKNRHKREIDEISEKINENNRKNLRDRDILNTELSKVREALKRSDEALKRSDENIKHSRLQHINELNTMKKFKNTEIQKLHQKVQEFQK